ncbi:MAG: hypothetical protein KKD07_01440 [Candidatus Omnitrophica bacterium]|nr:hypothetical protein [Candidatus Omnitrophota bacterium]MBU1995597.1 hypothetical protein [Candidatus Omnitrophota bacterium]MBU4333085.1 hypothetical protein [Candidatus Omnitrophota bacterium]
MKHFIVLNDLKEKIKSGTNIALNNRERSELSNGVLFVPKVQYVDQFLG